MPESSPALTPLDTAYALPDAASPIEVYEGPSVWDGGVQREIRIWAPLRYDAHLRWSTADAEGLELGQHEVMLLDSDIAGATAILEVNHTSGTGSVSQSNLGSDDALQRVVVHWVNAPLQYTLDRLVQGESSWRGRLVFRAHQWTYTFDARPDLSSMQNTIHSTGEEFIVTYVGEVRRSDGKTFSSEEVLAAIEAWQGALSFAFGRWVAPVLPVGFDSAGQRTWEYWARWRSDKFSGFQSWFPAFAADDLRSFLEAFVSAYLTPADHPVVRHLSRHALAANHSGTTIEARTMLAQAGIEYLAWIDLKLQGQLSKNEWKGLDAEMKMRLLLDRAGVPLGIPDELSALRSIQQRTAGVQDGPGAIRWVRNRLTHPKDADEPYRINDLLWQAAYLALEYLELLLLGRLGYAGNYSRRYPPGRPSTNKEIVPWAVEAPPGQ